MIRVKRLPRACGFCHAPTNGEDCGCADSFRKSWWLWCEFIPRYRISNRKFSLPRPKPTAPHRRVAHAH